MCPTLIYTSTIHPAGRTTSLQEPESKINYAQAIFGVLWILEAESSSVRQSALATCFYPMQMPFQSLNDKKVSTITYCHSYTKESTGFPFLLLHSKSLIRRHISKFTTCCYVLFLSRRNCVYHLDCYRLLINQDDNVLPCLLLSALIFRPTLTTCI